MKNIFVHKLRLLCYIALINATILKGMVNQLLTGLPGINNSEHGIMLWNSQNNPQELTKIAINLSNENTLLQDKNNELENKNKELTERLNIKDLKIKELENERDELLKKQKSGKDSMRKLLIASSIFQKSIEQKNTQAKNIADNKQVTNYSFCSSCTIF